MMDYDEFIQWEKASQDTIDFKKIYADIAGGLVAGLVLSQIIYWYLPTKDGKSKLKVRKNGELCLVKSRYDWWDEIRVSPRKVDGALKILEDKGIIKKEYHLFNSQRTTHIFLQRNRFLYCFNEILRTEHDNPYIPKGETKSLHKGKTGVDERVRPITETTSETTSEITSETTCKRLVKQAAPPFQTFYSELSNEQKELLKKDEGNSSHSLIDAYTYVAKQIERGKRIKSVFGYVRDVLKDKYDIGDESWYEWGFEKLRMGE